MAADMAVVTRPSRFTYGRLAYRRWRRNRPFWGGLFMILSGAFLFLSGNLELGNLQIHLGVTGFLSYIVPAFMILCGALAWATPSQRIFYGILGTIAALYSLISVNLGGFLLGMLLGIIGGCLTVAWVPFKAKGIAIPAQREPDPEPDPEPGPEAAAEPDESDAAWASTADIYDDHAGVPTAADGSYDENGPEDKQGERFLPPLPHARHVVDDGVSPDPVADPAELPYRSPRGVATGLVALLILGAIGFATLRNPAPAAAADCTPPTLTQLLNSATGSKTSKTAKQSTAAAKKSATGSKASKTAKTSTTPAKSSAPDPSASDPSAAASAKPGPLAPVTGIVGGILGGLGSVLAGGNKSNATPSPTPKPTDSPTSKPTDAPKPTATATPKPTKTSSPKPSSRPTGRPQPVVTPSASASCDVVAHMIAAAGGQPVVEGTPSIQTASTLTMTGLSYDGNVDLPTKSGTIKVMQFSMDSSTSTPFELDVTTKGQVTRIKSSSLTVSGNVKFYTTEIKGNVLGVLPQDYTPDNPPPVTPPLLFFTDVTIGLVDVVCDKLTAKDLSIK
jgi:Family of unknown function (DUF6114)